MTFAGTAAGIEARVVPREGFALDMIRSAGLKGKAPVARARGFVLLPLGGLDAWRSAHTPPARRRHRRRRLQLRSGGDGGGVRGMPTMVLEQNAMPGLTNR